MFKTEIRMEISGPNAEAVSKVATAINKAMDWASNYCIQTKDGAGLCFTVRSCAVIPRGMKYPFDGREIQPQKPK